jgi:MFS family permease
MWFVPEGVPMADTKTYEWALTGIFAAFHLVLTMIPLYLLGMGGGFISWGLISAPIVGFLLGPFYGLISVAIGSIMGSMFFNIGGVLGPIIPVFAPMASALVTGSIRFRRFRAIPIVFFLGLVVYIAGPIGLVTIPYLWLHLIAALLSLSMLTPMTTRHLDRLLDPSENEPTPTSSVFAWLSGFLALMADHLVGATMSQYYFFYVLGFDANTLTTSYLATIFLYPIERVLASIITGFVLVLLAVATSHGDIPLPEIPEKEAGLNEGSYA